MEPRDLRALAPEPFAAWDVVTATVPGALDATLIAVAERAVASSLGLGAVPALDPSDVDPAVTAFATQFVVDVAAVTDELRSAALRALGSDAFAFVQVCYVADLHARVRSAFEQCFDVALVPSVAPPDDLWAALEAFMRSVARLGAVDPLTTEIVRLRGARTHNCRLCKSLRNVRAANGGADEGLYEQIDFYETSALADRHKAALRLVDGMLWSPARYADGVVDGMRAHFTDEETIEIVLDVARNAANKIAVAFGADDAHVTDGIEFYDTDAQGELVYGLTPASGR